MDDNRPKPRRWFRFSLWTLFVLVTVACVWLGYQLNWIRDRQRYLEENPDALSQPFPQDKVATAPGLLWFLREPSVTRLCVHCPDFRANEKYHHTHPGAEAGRARELFP